MFLMLSGFLIAFSCLKELKSTGNIDYFPFIRNRFWRLWPNLVAYEVINIPGFYYLFRDPKALWHLKDLLFINNTQIGRFEPSHVWTVATEF